MPCFEQARQKGKLSSAFSRSDLLLQEGCCLSLRCMNVKSSNNKALSVANFVVTQGIDILTLTETWFGTFCDK